MTQRPRLGADDDRWQDVRATSRRSLWIALLLIGSYMLAEVAGGLISNSLALLADAGHMVADATAIGLALVAIWLAGRPASVSRTFGSQRTEILAALLNAFSLWLIAGWIFFEAYGRFLDPPEVGGVLMLAVGSVGLVINVAVARVLKASARHSLNVEGAFLHVIGDLLGSIGVVGAGILILVFGWSVADPIIGVIIGLLILFTSGLLIRKVVHVLMEGTPASLDLRTLCGRLEQVEGVTGVHDIHAWSITSGYEVLSAHVTSDAPLQRDRDRLLRSLRSIACGEFGIAHMTIQLEESLDMCHEAHHVVHEGGQTGGDETG